MPNLAVIDSGLKYKSKPVRGSFWNYKVVLNETVPGLSNLAGVQYQGGDPPKKGNSPMEVVTAVPVTTFHLNLLWSASWNAWDGPPRDQPSEWQMSFCSTALDSQRCGTGPAMVVDVTPRRVQRFVITPGQTYNWEVRRASDNAFIANGTATAGNLLTIPRVQIWPEGVRLRIWK